MGDKLKNIYSKIVLTNPRYCILKPIEAEISKIAINGFLTMKISYCIMISQLTEKFNGIYEQIPVNLNI